MKHRATVPLLLALVLVALPAFAQDEPIDVTVRQINELPEENIQTLQTSSSTLSAEEYDALVTNDLDGEIVRFTAVVLSNPRNSGLSTPDDGLPSRVHVFVRDTSAATQGNEGMGVQIVDGAWETNGTLGLTVGDVITVTGEVAPFFSTMQIAPESIENHGPYQAFGLPDDILDPVLVTTADVNAALGEGNVNPNWDLFQDLRGQYVRIEGAAVVSRNLANRPRWYISSDGNETVVNIYDTSLRYRNDRRGTYDTSEFNVRTDDFVPPPPGARVNLQGFLTLAGSAGADPDTRATPAGRLLSINPMADSDLEITETPPIISNLSAPEGIPGTDPVEITVDVDPDPARTLTSVELHYTTSSTTDTTTIAMTHVEGEQYTATIPAAADDDFVSYYVTAEDSEGASTASGIRSYRVLSEGITQIRHIQETASGRPADSPFAGQSVSMDITATVQTSPNFSACNNCVLGFAIQDDPELGPWSGILIRDAEGVATLEPGDVINITEAEVFESFGVTTLRNVTYTVEESGEPLPHKVLTTDLLTDSGIAEAHEGMLLRFERVVVTEPDAGFGEWLFSSDGTTDNQIKGDDASDEFFETDFFVETFEEGDEIDYLQGLWWFSFSEYKLIPVTTADVGTATDIESDELVASFGLDQNYPNPFNPSTSITYSVPVAGQVTIDVFDTLGRKVATLVNGQLPAGQHSVTFNAEGLASGLYVYRLRAGEKVTARTMMLVK